MQHHPLPILYLTKLTPNSSTDSDTQPVNQILDYYCQKYGFFILRQHSIQSQQLRDLYQLAQSFFCLKQPQKQEIKLMKFEEFSRGWFRLNSQTKEEQIIEGLYYDSEVNKDGCCFPMFAKTCPELMELTITMKNHIQTVNIIGHNIITAITNNLSQFFKKSIIQQKSKLQFGILSYSPTNSQQYIVGEHTDDCFINILCLDHSGGLQIRMPSGEWVNAPKPAINDYLILVLIGDQLQKLSGKRYKSVPHRVKSVYQQKRVSMPLFFVQKRQEQ